MNDDTQNTDQHLIDLLIEQAGGALDAAKAGELQQLTRRYKNTLDTEGLELAIAAAYRAFDRRARDGYEPMPKALTQKVIAQGRAHVAARTKPTR